MVMHQKTFTDREMHVQVINLQQRFFSVSCDDISPPIDSYLLFVIGLKGMEPFYMLLMVVF